MMNRNSIKCKRSSYEANFKLKVVLHAEKTNNCDASRKYCVNEKLIRDWRKRKTVLEQMPRSKLAIRYGKPQFPEMEEELNKWVVDCRQNGYIVTRTTIRFHALNLLKEERFQSIKPVKFHASSGWCTRFMNRNNLVLRQRTKISQKLPKDLEDKVMEFQKFIIKQRKLKNFQLKHIGNMDEVPMTFDLPNTRTVNPKGDKTVLIKTTGHEKTHFTVALSCLADGSKLSPFVIFKRKTLPKGLKIPPGILVRTHEKGWMDEKGISDWLNNVWNKRPGAILKKNSLLVWDMFCAHRCENIKSLAKTMNTTLCVIPGGMTSVLQPLDVCLNKPFKNTVRKLWSEWMNSGSAEQTKGGNLKKPDINIVISWIKDAWEALPNAMVEKSFKKCCISNSLDGTEDDIVYNEDYKISLDVDDKCDELSETSLSENKNLV